MIEKVIHSQDSYYKLQYRKSGETSLNLSNEIKDMLAPSLQRGNSKQITFVLYKEDYIKASCYIIGHLPLYKSSSKDCKCIEYDESLLLSRIESIQGFFGNNENAEYTVNLLYREDGRIYLNELKQNGFNLREYLVEEHTTLIFDVIEGKNVIRLKNGEVRDSIENNREISPITIGDAPSTTLQYLSAIRTKPFLLLAGISGTGKSQIVRKLAQATDDIDNFVSEEERWNCHKPANFELIQVKPNWHNSMDVVGYKSNIGGAHYEFTPFVEFVAKAWHYQDTPFFLCLDEMNLAPVEEYFAEYLSAIESRSYEEQYETDPIIKPFSSYGEDLCEEMVKHLVYTSDPKLKAELMSRFALKGLTLPPNLIVMGTVNMDETTFSFSRKVLDRAMSIEMNEVNMANCIHRNTEQQVPILTDMNKRLVNRAIKSVEVIEGNQESKIDEMLLSVAEANEIVEYLDSVNILLDGTPFKLGYRACNEALLYARACKELKRDITKGIDEFTMMKILSRIEGDDAKLAIEENDERIERLGFVKSDVVDVRYNEANILSCMKAIIKPRVASEAESIKKIDEMNAILHRDHFVSYWG